MLMQATDFLHLHLNSATVLYRNIEVEAGRVTLPLTRDGSHGRADIYVRKSCAAGRCTHAQLTFPMHPETSASYLHVKVTDSKSQAPCFSTLGEFGHHKGCPAWAL